MQRNEYDVLQLRLARFLRRNFHRLGAQDIEDVCQQSWETLYRHRDVEGRSVPNAFPFLCQAARWSGLSLMRAGRRCQPVPEIPEPPGPAEETPEAFADRVFSERQLVALLDDMDPDQQELTRLVLAEEPRPLVEEKLGISGNELVDMWARTRSELLDRALSQKGSPVRRAMLVANGEDRLSAELRVTLDGAAAGDPGLCLELVASL
jgi:hypothetical protein